MVCRALLKGHPPFVDPASDESTCTFPAHVLSSFCLNLMLTPMPTSLMINVDHR